MPSFKKRVFGAEVPDDIQIEFQRIGGGGLKGNPKALSEVKPSYKNYSLGDKTGFARMWTAVMSNVWNLKPEGREPHRGETIYKNSEGTYYFHPNNEIDDANSAAEIGYQKDAEIMIFSVNENRSKSYKENKNPLSQVQAASDTQGQIQYRRQLGVNPLLNPEAGITNLISKTQGALGALQSVTVEFVVHNKFDFDNIFLPYFMRPGSIVCVDYGWSDPTMNLYSIEEKIKNSDVELKGFDNFIYNTFLPKNFGKVNTVMGNVVNYDSTMNSDGSFNCSVEIISRNAGLLDRESDDDIKFLFTNTINDVVAQIFAASSGIELNLDHVIKNLQATEPLDTSEIAKRFISEISDIETDQQGRFTPGIIPDVAIKNGVFHQNMAPNKKVAPFFAKNSRFTTIQSGWFKDKSQASKEQRELYVADATLSSEVTYISWGRFEDLFLNNFLVAMVTTEKKPNGTVVDQSFEELPDEDFSHKYDSRGVYVRYDDLFIKFQQSEISDGEALPSFLIPSKWDESYNSTVLKIDLNQTEEDKKPDKNSDVKYNVSTEDQISGKHPNYPNISVIPLRDVFIAVPLIISSFDASSSANDAIASILDALNFESNFIWNLKIVAGTNAKTGIKIQDINLIPVPEEERLIFDVTGPTSIVKNCDLKFSTPSDGLASILAIGNMTGPREFMNNRMAQLSFLNLLNKPEQNKPNEFIYLKSLPDQGKTNEIVGREKVNTLKIANVIKQINTNIIEKGAKNVERKYGHYLEAIQKAQGTQEQDPEKPEEFSFTSTKGYQNIYARTEFVGSYRQYYKQALKRKYFGSSSDGSVAPILPVELNLTIYGNNYLQIGDFFTINYLPEYYKERVFFQIMGIEDKIGTDGWETTYQTIMRVNPNSKEIITGKSQNEVIAPEKDLAIEFPLSTVTSIAVVMTGNVKDGIERVSTVVDKTASYRVPKTAEFINGDLEKKIKEKLPIVEMDFEIYEHKVDLPKSWGDVEPLGMEQFKENSKTRIEVVDYDVPKMVRFHQSRIPNISDLGNPIDLAYAFAVREALMSENTIIDYKKGVEITQGIESSYPELNAQQLDDNIPMMINFDRPDDFIGDGHQDFIDVWKDNALGIINVQNWKIFRDDLLQILNKNTKYAIDSTLADVMEATKLDNIFSQVRMTAEQDQAFVGTGNQIYPVPITDFYFALDHTTEDFQDMYIIEATKGPKVFTHIPIPKWLIKKGDGTDANPTKTVVDFMNTLIDSFQRYFLVIDEFKKGKIGSDFS